jgi:hypothetical protein
MDSPPSKPSAEAHKVTPTAPAGWVNVRLNVAAPAVAASEVVPVKVAEGDPVQIAMEIMSVAVACFVTPLL